MRLTFAGSFLNTSVATLSLFFTLSRLIRIISQVIQLYLRRPLIREGSDWIAPGLHALDKQHQCSQSINTSPLCVCVCWGGRKGSHTLQQQFENSLPVESCIIFQPGDIFTSQTFWKGNPPFDAEIRPWLCARGPLVFKLRSASGSGKMRALHKTTETVAEGRTFANEDMLL